MLSQPRQPPFLFGQPCEAVWPTNPPRSASTSPSRPAGTQSRPGSSAQPPPLARRCHRRSARAQGCSPSPRHPGGLRSRLRPPRPLPGGGSRSHGAVTGAAPSFSAPGTERGPRGAAPGIDPLLRGGAAGGWSIQGPGAPQPPPSPAVTGAAAATPRAGRSPGRGGTPRGRTWQPRQGPTVTPSPTPARTHRAEPRDPPGRPPLPRSPVPCASRLRPLPPAASPGPAPPPPGRGRPRRARETTAGPRGRPPSSPDGPAPHFPFPQHFLPRVARGSSLREQDRPDGV